MARVGLEEVRVVQLFFSSETRCHRDAIAKLSSTTSICITTGIGIGSYNTVLSEFVYLRRQCRMQDGERVQFEGRLEGKKEGFKK